MTTKEHAQTLGLLFYLYVGLNLLLTAFSGVFILMIFGSLAREFAAIPARVDQPSPFAMFSFIGFAMVAAIILSVVILIPALIAAIKVRKGSPAARIWLIIASALAVINFPIGTILGAYGMWFVFSDTGRQFFESADNEFAAGVPPPPHNWQ